MRLFVSYAARDAELVTALQLDLEQFGHDLWRDVKIIGGQQWWDQICAQLRQCDGVVFALSPSSARSRACQSELDYALALDRPVLPIMIADTKLATAPVAVQTRNIVPYLESGHASIIALAAALTTTAAGTPLPTPLPEPPPAPMGDIPALRDRIVLPKSLDQREQHDLVQRLRELFDGGEDVAFELTRLLRGRDLYESAGRAVDELLASEHIPSAFGSEGRALIKSLVSQERKLTPIMGSGLTDSLVGTRRDMARSFAKEFEFPLAQHLRDDLPQVAQFVKVVAGDITLRDRLQGHLEQRLRDTLGPQLPDATTGLDALFAAVWDARDPAVPDPHELLAGMACSIYVTAHPSQLLEHALRKAGKEPEVDVCRWKLDDPYAKWPPSPFDTSDDQGFEPSVKRPLVFHVFGLLEWPDTLVVTEDDFFRFLTGVTSEREVPGAVRSRLADSALLVLGFQLDDWDFRALWQTLMVQEGNGLLKKYKHVAAQVDPAGTVSSPAATRSYLNKYFGHERIPALDLFWGSVSDFATALYAERGRPA